MKAPSSSESSGLPSAIRADLALHRTEASRPRRDFLGACQGIRGWNRRDEAWRRLRDGLAYRCVASPGRPRGSNPDPNTRLHPLGFAWGD